MRSSRAISLGWLLAALAPLAACEWVSYDERMQRCGDGVAFPTRDATKIERCDGEDLDDKKCTDLPSEVGTPYTGGALACKGDCTFDTSGCSLCGDNRTTGKEECDGELSSAKTTTCASLGQGYLSGDVTACKSDCTFDVSGCLPYSYGFTYKEDSPITQAAVNGMAVDSKDNVYFTGSFQGVAIFGDTWLTSAGGRDIFVAMLNSDGKLQWAAAAGGAGEDVAHGVVLGKDGDLYIAGSFQGSATFGARVLTARGKGGSSDIFVARLSSAGAFHKATSAGGEDEDVARAVALDTRGKIYITGSSQGTVPFGAGTVVPGSATAKSDIFVAWLDTDLALEGAIGAGGPGEDTAHGVSVDSRDNVHIAGSFQQTATFGAAPGLTLTSRGKRDIFVARYDVKGSRFAWATAGGGAYDDMAFGVDTDDSGNSYITGRFDDNSVRSWNAYAPALFGKHSLESTKKQSSYGDILVASLDSAGRFRWARSAGSPGVDTGRGVAADHSGGCYVTGSFYSGPVLGADTLISRGGTDIFLARYGAAGALWGVSTGGGLNDEGRAVAVGSKGALLVGGAFSSEAKFGLKTTAQDFIVFELRHAR